MVRIKQKDSMQLTDVELEMMNIIWRVGACTVHQIMEHLPKDRPLAYTSVSTMVRILEQKNFVSSRKDGRGHLYQAAVAKEEYEASSVNQLVKNVFQGEPTSLVKQLLTRGDLSQQDIAEIRKLLDERSS